MPRDASMTAERLAPDRLSAAEQAHWATDWWRPETRERMPRNPADFLPEERWSPVPFWSLMAFTAVLLFSPQNYFPSLALFRPALLVIGVGLAAYMSDRWSRGKPFVEWTRPMKLIVALLVWAAVTTPLSLWPGGSASVLVEYLKTVTIFWLLSQVVASKQRLQQVAWLLTWMAVGLGFFVVYNYATGAVAAPSSVNERVMGNEGGLTKNPNDMALMINLIVPLTVALWLGERQGLRRHVLTAVLALEGGAVVLTYSRGGAVTLGVIFLLYVWKFRRRPERSWLFGLIVIALLALPLAPSSYFERLSTITDVNADRTGSAQERLNDMIIAAKRILSSPLIGTGIGMNTLAMNEARGGGWLPVHNVYLEHGLDLGLPGLVLFLALLRSCLQATTAAQRVYERLGQSDMRLLAEGLQVSLLAYATAAMFHPVSYHLYFYYMAGLAVAAWIMSTKARRTLEVDA